MKTKKRRRLDQVLVENGYFKSVDEAEVAIRLGRIRSQKSGQRLEKPGELVATDLSIVVEEGSPFVGRGGLKLEGFLTEAKIPLNGITALDVGSSTGGFTDCLLKRGVSQVYCVDVGKHQLHEDLRNDPRVKVFEGTDIRNFDFSVLQTQLNLVVVDLSFISIRSVAKLLRDRAPTATFIFLFKPQFEVSQYIPKKRGVAPESESKKSLQEMLLFLKTVGLNPLMIRESNLKGAKGNQETFIMADARIPSHIFRTYDIRGNADRDISDLSAEKIGRAFGRRVLKAVGAKAKVGLGRDARLSSPRIFNAISRGLTSVGVEILDLGEIATPMAYFAHYHFEIDALLMITASHNPKEDNGMKMMITRDTLFGPEITSLGNEAEDEVIGPRSSLSKIGSIATELRVAYLNYLHSHIRLSQKRKIILDCGNGMVGTIARDAFAPYSSSLDILYEDVDCRFPNHEADPTIPANLEALQKAVIAKNADVGFAFDGDGDRLGVITSKGRILWGDEILMLLSELVLKQIPGSTIIGEVKCSEKLFRMIKDRGGNPLMYKTGHSLIKKKMKEVKAPIAGEMSGHLFFADRYFGFDDATYGALRVLEVMDQLQIDLDEWISRYPASFVTPEIRVHCEESEKVDLVERVKSYFTGKPEAHLNLIDGIRVGFLDSSWALVRASNTQAVLVVRIEAQSRDRLMAIGEELSKALGRRLELSFNV